MSEQQQRPKRAVAKSKFSLDGLKEAREGGSRLDQLDFEKEEQDVFDVMDEEKYAEHVKAQREKGDFVVDDEGLGYYDDGEEVLGVGEDEYDAKRRLKEASREGDQKAAKKARKLAEQSSVPKNSILRHLHTGVSSNTTTKEVAAQSLLNIDELMGSSNPTPVRRAPPQRRPVVTRPPVNYAGSYHTSPADDASSSYHDNNDYGGDMSYDNGDYAPDMTPNYSSSEYNTPLNSDTKNTNNNNNADSADRIDQIAQSTEQSQENNNKVQKISLSKSSNKFKVNTPALVSTPKFDTFKTNLSAEAMTNSMSALAEITDKNNNNLTSPGEGGTSGSGYGKLDPSTWLLKTPETNEEYVHMYWIDASENNGVLYLFGKIPVATDPKTPNVKKFVSSCLIVHGSERNLFVLPRVEPDQFNQDGTPKRKGLGDVYAEINNILVPEVIPKSVGQAFRCKQVPRKYAFEHGNVPREETNYLKVVYSAKHGVPTHQQCQGGRTYERIFGATSSSLELFLLKRKLMGPCWITIKNPKVSNETVSWCKVEINCENPKFITKFQTTDTNPMPSTPTLTSMSISMKTAINPTTHTHEIISLSGITHRKVDSEADSEQSNKVMSQFTLIRQLGLSCGPNYPSVFPHDVVKNGFYMTFPNERALLSYFMTKIQLEDPDIMSSHNLLGFEFDVILARVVANKLANWSLLGRLRKSKPPKSINDKDAAAGRILCDTYRAAKEFLRETTYSLTHLAYTQLKQERVEVEPVDVPKFFSSAADINALAIYTATDAKYVQGLMFKLQVIPLTKQLTNLSGNLWSRTIRGARAERIEYLLLHEFHTMKYILPEKKQFDNKKNNNRDMQGVEDDMEELDGVKNKVVGTGRKRAKAAYAGGLVLEPKKGLYDTYILLLDFNSLYPSIIQEYNLCFSTINWTKYMPTEATTSTTTPTTSAPSTPSGKKDKRVKVVTPGVGSNNHNNDEEDDDNTDDDDSDNEGETSSGNKLPPLPDTNSEPGILPRVIKNLVDRRRAVKNILKNEKDPIKRQELDIRQKALKLTANSMYGCLGFSFSRFYARPIAALVTAQGREALQRTVDFATNKMSLDVIYGDTDSVMINTNLTDIAKVREIGNTVKREVNKLYKSLELDLDGIFKSMLLLKKKKYAAVTINEGPDGKLHYEHEMKGLDLVRRDWCPLSKNTGRYVVEAILSGKSREEIVIDIHEHLSDLAAKIRAGAIPIDEFVVTKGLNKNPKDYPDCKGQAHLQVALQMLKENKPVIIGQHIPYVICIQGPEGSHAAQRAHHPDEVKRSTNNELTLDYEWYLANQILPPISRLCEPIEGTSPAIISEKLGLDATKFARTNQSDELGEDGWGFTPKCQLDDNERFKDCIPLKCICSACKLESNFVSVLHVTEGRSGLNCSNCGALFFGRNSARDCYCYISNRVTILVRECLKRYYECWLVCDDHSCGRRTMQQSVKGYACTEDCHGRMIQEYDEAALHTQLKYLESLFDVPRLVSKKSLNDSQLRQLIPADQIGILNLLKQHMSNSVNGSAYNWIRPSLWSSLFGKLHVSGGASGSNNNGVAVISNK